MYYLLFTFYCCLGAFIITRIPFIKQSGLPARSILLLFLLKIFAGLFLGWISYISEPTATDYGAINYFGRLEYELLLSDPKAFFINIFYSPYHHYGGFFSSTGSYWNDLENNIIIKLLAFTNIFSGGNYYINSLFFNFIGFFGHIALYRVFMHVYTGKKWEILTGCFLIPSTLYFSSGIHKDLIVFTMLGLFFYALYFSLLYGSTWRKTLLLLLSFLLILLIRNFVALALLPGIIAWFISGKFKLRPLPVFLTVYTALLLLGTAAQVFTRSVQPLTIISNKQKDYLQLPTAHTQMESDSIPATIKGFVEYSPRAMNKAFMRPYPGEFTGLPVQLIALELLACQGLFLLMIVFYKKPSLQSPSFILLSLFFGFSLLLLTGYIVPNAGALVRYRNLYLPYLLVPMLCSINWAKLKAFLYIK